MNVRIIYINDKERPDEIPSQNWIKKGTEYTLIYIHWHVAQGVQGFSLAEICPPVDCPYESYKASRFAIHKDDILKFIRLAEECTNMNNVEIKQLVEQLNTIEQ